MHVRNYVESTCKTWGRYLQLCSESPLWKVCDLGTNTVRGDVGAHDFRPITGQAMHVPSRSMSNPMIEHIAGPKIKQ